MDKIDDYRQYIKQFLQRYIDMTNRRKKSEVEDFLVVDEANDNYFWMTWGWDGKKRVKAIQVFVRIKDNKIWVEEDWTEVGIANDLAEKGVSKDSIVLGFQPPEMRQYTEFAVA